jgi:cysteine desulfurase
MALDLRGVACSAGSACQSGSVEPSHVLAALGVRSDVESAAVRMSLGCLTSPQCVERAAETFAALALRTRRGASAPAGVSI